MMTSVMLTKRLQVPKSDMVGEIEDLSTYVHLAGAKLQFHHTKITKAKLLIVLVHCMT